MNTYLISYDLHQPGRDYQALHDKIKSLANGWWHNLESVWIINSSYSATSIRDGLKTELDSNDELLVVSLGSSWATYNISKKGNDWIRTNLNPGSLAA